MHAKNSTVLQKSQAPTLGNVGFGDPLMEYTSPIFCVVEGGSIADGLSIAAELADGLTQLCMRLHHAVNDGEIAFCAELRALAFISDSVNAITRSAQRSLSAAAKLEAAVAQ